MNDKKVVYKKVRRVILTLICCLPIFVILNTILEGANQVLLVFIDMVIGGIILFAVQIIADKRERKLEEMHERYMEEKANRDRYKKSDKNQGN